MKLNRSLNNVHESDKSLFVAFNEGEFESSAKAGDGTSDMKTM